MKKTIREILDNLLKENANLGYRHFKDILGSFDEWEHYRETSKVIVKGNHKFKVTTGLMWDDVPDQEIRVVIEVKKPIFILFSKTERGGFVVNRENKIEFT